MIQEVKDATVFLAPLGVALGLSVIIERVVEFLKNMSDLIRQTPRDRAFPKLASALAPADELPKLVETDKRRRDEEQRATDLKAKLDALEARSETLGKERQQLQQRQQQGAAVADELKAKESEMSQLVVDIDSTKAQLQALNVEGVWEERVPAETMLVEPATDPDEGSTMRVFLIQAIASALGIITAHFGHVGVFSPLFEGLGHSPVPAPVDYMLTGLFIGGGSGPVHVLIQFISERKVPMPEKPKGETSIPKATVASPGADPAVVQSRATSLATSTIIASTTALAPVTAVDVAAPPTVSTSTWVDIGYDGGVDTDILANVHRRSDDPNLIVFHHTAMDSHSTFEDVVRVIKGRTDSKGHHWLTGYHCVVLFDGSIHPFCRWDRFGNHAEGYNDRSLGITLNGNFETDPSVPDSNPTGRRGATRPSEAQLESAARVVALWCHLYGIPADFEKSIIPHKWIATTKKTCPGSNFPYDDFRRRVTFYRDEWDNMADAKMAIASFARKPHLFSGSRKAVWA